MKIRLIAILAMMALIVSTLSGVTWYYNSYMQVKDDSMNLTSNNTQIPINNSDNIKIQPVNTTNNYNNTGNLIIPKEGQPIKNFVLVAQESIVEISSGVNTPVWTFNGTVPGPEIRVIQGDFVRVQLKNNLKDPVTIHWHGYPVKSVMDGIPGVTQDAIKPGESFTYEFSADVSGTYWYHSHQDGSNQVDKGLYGALIVEPKEKEKIDKDFTLILDEWMSDPSGMSSMSGTAGNSSNNSAMGGMSGMSNSSDSTSATPIPKDNSSMDMSGMNAASATPAPKDNSSISMSGMNSTQSAVSASMNDEEQMAYMYDIYTVNAKSGDLISPLKVKKGDVVRLRFINAGYRTHGIHIPGQDIRVVSTDGQDINGAGLIKDQILVIAPGERYDVEFTINTDDNFIIDAHDDNAYNDQLKIPVNIEGGSGNTFTEPDTTDYPEFDLATYGTPNQGDFSLDQRYDVDYQVELSTRLNGKTLKYTINGTTFDELPPLALRTGNLVKFTFINKSDVNHPMHLHGHFFQILSRNDKPFSGAVIMKDTILVKPGEKYVVAFQANNPGKWMLHCHELHHAAGGMMQEIDYTDYNSDYSPNPNDNFNNPT